MEGVALALAAEGADLTGNTFWELLAPSPSSTTRLRRILVPSPTGSLYHSDISIPPQWHQWLRHTRSTPPTMAEQVADVARREQLVRLAQAADERWDSKASLLERPREDLAQPGPATKVNDPGGYSPNTWEGHKRGVRNAVETPGPEAVRGAVKSREKSPWDQATGRGPSEAWQPEAWDPSTAPETRRS
ncbi:MAG: hypothetical protein M1832_002616 [Thelocarpon impressellum]|nr:MAG: hypothetical protein M1832_002616 [Thelocarpon impressellum]